MTGRQINHRNFRGVQVFCRVWQAGNAATHKQLLKLYFTWKAVFPSPTLIMIDAAMRQMNKPPSGAACASGLLEDKVGKVRAQVGISNAPAGHVAGQHPGREGVRSPTAASNGVKEAEAENGKECSEIGQISDGMTVNVSSLVSLLLQSAAAGVNSKSDAGSCVLEAKELTPAVVKVSKEVGSMVLCKMPVRWPNLIPVRHVIVLFQAINRYILSVLERLILLKEVRKENSSLGINEGTPYHSMI